MRRSNRRTPVLVAYGVDRCRVRTTSAPHDLWNGRDGNFTKNGRAESIAPHPKQGRDSMTGPRIRGSQRYESLGQWPFLRPHLAHHVSSCRAVRPSVAAADFHWCSLSRRQVPQIQPPSALPRSFWNGLVRILAFSRDSEFTIASSIQRSQRQVS
jgi:hypothetical protein